MDLSFFEFINVIFTEFYVVFLCAAFIFGLLMGSFLNVVIYRLPISIFDSWREDCNEFLKIPDDPTLKNQMVDHQTITVSSPKRSFCPHCKHQISLKHNIPLISFIFLQGKCFNCKQPISWRYPIIEFIAALVTVLVCAKFGAVPLTVYLLILSYLLIVIAAIDFDHLIIPDHLTYIGLWLGLLLNASLLPYSIPMLIFPQLAILGAVIGYLSLWSLYWVFKLLTGKEGFGHGDFKLTALFGAWLGVYSIFPILIIASVLAIIISLANHFCNKIPLDRPFPFGPYLAVAGWLVLMYGHYWPIKLITIF